MVPIFVSAGTAAEVHNLMKLQCTDSIVLTEPGGLQT